jgi:hypothetical protein
MVAPPLEIWLRPSLSGKVRFANVIRAFYAGSTVSVTIKLFNCKQQSGKLASHSPVL